ncbi:MAG: tRNA pseudouridine(38-40) synthase TruA [Clostridia bacterium]|nr:tRNA pseudouridine(38-40) synthase TruA [Clostridia bacterium]
MKRILLTVEYDGTAYAGWQRQINGLAVQQVLEEALSSACGHPVSVTGASRTDAGVHALDQKVHFDTDCPIPPDKYPFVLNTMLPPDIRVLEGREVPESFHARFLTSGKIYTYRIWNARHGSAMRRNTHWHIPVPLDEKPVREALLTLPGSHDFAAFQAAGGTAKTTVRTLRSAELSVSGNEWTLTVSGDAFLYNMVRIIAGTVAEIGLGRLCPDAFTRAFDTLDRLALGMTAPAHGLELTKVFYPDQAFTDPASLRWHEEETTCSD